VLDLLQRMTTNNVLPLKAVREAGTVSGMGTQTVVLTEKARMLDVCTVLARENDVLMLCSEGKAVEIMAWLDKFIFVDDVQLTDTSATFGAVMVMGPRSPQLLAELTGNSVQDLRGCDWQEVILREEFGGISMMVVKQPPLCELCYILLFDASHQHSVEAVLLGLGNDVPVLSEHTFEVLRIEAAWGKSGTEWTDQYNPLEAGLVGLVSFTKGCYIGQEVIARLDTYNKVKMRLSGFIAAEPIPEGARFFDDNAAVPTVIGTITSSAYSPELAKYIALGYIRSNFANPGTSVFATTEERQISTEIIKLPFLM
jgi:tRNA-modifying protein YgfZ